MIHFIASVTVKFDLSPCKAGKPNISNISLKLAVTRLISLFSMKWNNNERGRQVGRSLQRNRTNFMWENTHFHDFSSFILKVKTNLDWFNDGANAIIARSSKSSQNPFQNCGMVQFSSHESENCLYFILKSQTLRNFKATERKPQTASLKTTKNTPSGSKLISTVTHSESHLSLTSDLDLSWRDLHQHIINHTYECFNLPVHENGSFLSGKSESRYNRKGFL